jgi:hypothetical protein
MSSPFAPSFNMRVTVTICIDAEDFLEAAEHQKRLEASMGPLLAAYPSARVKVSRGRSGPPESMRSVRLPRVGSGKVNHYA